MAVIQTVYRGVKFRSRLEARWAVFFDSLNVRWEYEKEGFDLAHYGSKPYLPDFWLPDFQYWIEIKGELPTSDERWSADALAAETQKKVFIFWGEIPESPVYMDDRVAFCAIPGSGEDCQYNWCQCLFCGQLGIEFQGRSDRLPCHDIDGCPRSPHGDKGYNLDSSRLLAAYKAARSARFEHGEKGATL